MYMHMFLRYWLGTGFARVLYCCTYIYQLVTVININYMCIHVYVETHTFRNFSVFSFSAVCLPVIKTSLLSKSRRSSSEYSGFTGLGRLIFNLIASPMNSNGISSLEVILYWPYWSISLTLEIAVTSKEPCVSFNSLNQSRWLLHSTYI